MLPWIRNPTLGNACIWQAFIVSLQFYKHDPVLEILINVLIMLHTIKYFLVILNSFGHCYTFYLRTCITFDSQPQLNLLMWYRTFIKLIEHLNKPANWMWHKYMLFLSIKECNISWLNIKFYNLWKHNAQIRRLSMWNMFNIIDVGCSVYNLR